MEARKIILCRGIQGSGKSTWAKAWATEDPEHRVRFNNDDVRNMAGVYWVPSREKLITTTKSAFITSALINGYDVVIDNMNLNPKEYEWAEKVADILKKEKNLDITIEFKDFFIPVEECIRRDAMRPNPIGEKVIRQTWNRYKLFIQTQAVKNYVDNLVKQDFEKPAAIILDMDSTLCFNTTGRPWYGEGSEAMINDEANLPIINLADIYADRGVRIFIITGRDTSQRKMTEKWLEDHLVCYENIFYRKKGDFRKSADIKKEIVTDLMKDYRIEFIVDDADPVVEMYREMGLTVLQPNRTI